MNNCPKRLTRCSRFSSGCRFDRASLFSSRIQKIEVLGCWNRVCCWPRGWRAANWDLFVGLSTLSSLVSMFSYFLDLLCSLNHRRQSSSTGTSVARQGEFRNIVILGSLGVGKSSLVNMLVGRAVAPVSNDIGVAHPAIVEYPISLGEIPSDTHPHRHPSSSDLVLRFYDTLGLDHRPSPWGAIKARLQRSGGAHVVVYCMRRGRLSSEQIMHLHTIRKTFCHGDVPLLLVVSGVEYRRGSAGKWWEANGDDLENAVQVKFADHICVNTWDAVHPSWRQHGATYEETQRLVRDLMICHCGLRSVS